MAENEAVLGTDIDVDTLDDAQVAELKGKMMEQSAEKPAEKQAEPAPKEPETAETQQADATEHDEDGEPKSETVPHGRFHRERELRKQAETRAQELERNYSVLSDRLTQLFALQQQPMPAQQQEQPDGPPSDDPVSALNWLVERYKQQEQRNAEQATMYQQQAGHQQFVNSLAQAENAFRATADDYDAALSFMAQSRDTELRLAYPMSTEQQRQQYILTEWSQMAAANFEAGRNPAQQIYELAKARGYAKAAPAPDAQAQQAAAEIAKREEARQASMSLGATGGGVANTGQVTPEQLLDMSDEDFEAYKKKHGGSIARAFM